MRKRERLLLPIFFGDRPRSRTDEEEGYAQGRKLLRREGENAIPKREQSSRIEKHSFSPLLTASQLLIFSPLD